MENYIIFLLLHIVISLPIFWLARQYSVKNSFLAWIPILQGIVLKDLSKKDDWQAYTIIAYQLLVFLLTYMFTIPSFFSFVIVYVLFYLPYILYYKQIISEMEFPSNLSYLTFVPFVNVFAIASIAWWKKENVKHLTKIVSILIILVILIIPIFLSVSIRMTPLYLPQTDDIAESTIRGSLQQQVAAEVNRQYPFASETERNKLIAEQTQSFIRANSAEYTAQIQLLSQQYKSQFQDEYNQTYLIALDPYFYFRLVRNIVNTGIAGEYINEDGQSASNFQLAPSERVQEGNELHVHFSVLWHKFLNMFGNVPVSTSFFVVPVVIMGLAVIPAFFLGRRLSNNWGGFLAATLVALNPFILSRTIGGFSDTDSYNVLFPLLIVWLLVEAFHANSLKKQIAWGAASGVAVTLFSWAWQAWWFIVALLAVGFAVAIGVKIIQAYLVHRNKKYDTTDFTAIKNKVISLCIIGFVFVIVATIGLFMIGKDPLSVVKSPLNALTSSQTLKAAANANLWPNIFTTVAELNPGNINSIIAQSGNGALGFISRVLFGLAIIGLIFLPFKNLNFKKKTTSINFIDTIFLAVWFFGTIYMTLQGVRFTLLYVPVAAVLIGVTLGYFFTKIRNILSEQIQIPKTITTMCFIFFLGFIFLLPQNVISGEAGILTQASNQANGAMPNMNDDYYNLLLNIKENTNETAIISSWWDFGHQFITIAERGASSDGANQNRPQTYWLARALITDNPDEFKGISRMLNCDSNGAYNKIFSYNQDTFESLEITKAIILLEREEAQEYLEQFFSTEQTTDILQSSHCANEVESLWIASSDMVGKAGVWAHFGSWDFTRAKLWNLRNRASDFIPFHVEEFNSTEGEARSLMIRLQSMSQDEGDAWIAPFPQYYTGKRDCTVQENTTWVCSIGLQVSQTDQIAGVTVDTVNNFNTTVYMIMNGQQAQVIPKTYAFIDMNGEYTIVNNPNGADIGVAVFPDQKVMVMHSDLAASMFTRMFYYNAYGLDEYVQKFDDVTTITGLRFIVYERVI